MKRKKCELCQKRYFKVQDWKKGEELLYCQTCRTFMNNLDVVLRGLQKLAAEVGLKVEFNYKFLKEENNGL